MHELLARRRPSPAMAVAFVALLAALSGTAVALPGKNTVDSGDIRKGNVKTSDIRKNAVRGGKVRNGSLAGADVKNDSLTGADVRESTLGQVPSAASATNAGNAATLGGAPPAAYAASAQPAFQNATLAAGFTNFSPSHQPAGFMKDTLGFVHLRGTMNCPAGENTAFTLPAGFRPALIEFGPLPVGGEPGGNLQVEPDGDVRPFLPDAASACGLSGFSFKAEQ